MNEQAEPAGFLGASASGGCPGTLLPPDGQKKNLPHQINFHKLMQQIHFKFT
jgi:hypothetical protein